MLGVGIPGGWGHPLLSVRAAQSVQVELRATAGETHTTILIMLFCM